jgi:two-component system cell cycle sensor histidine kinase/response regulator CckA
VSGQPAPEPSSERRSESPQPGGEALREVLASLPLVLWSVDRDGRFLISEGGALETLGLEPGEAVGRNVFTMYRENPEIIDAIRRGLSGEAAGWIVSVSGRTFETESRPLRGPDGSIEGLGGTSIDVTGRQKAEEQLRESEARYRLLFATNPVPMWVYDAETLRFLAVNEAAVAHYGYSESEFHAMTVLQIRPSGEIPGFLEDLRDAGSGTEPAKEAALHRRKNGEEI